MHCKYPGSFLVCLVAASAIWAIGAVPATATNSGLDTPTGVTSLPFSVEGTQMMTLTETGLGIGMSSPQVPLDVNGTAHFISNYNGGFPAYGGTLGSEGGLAIGWNGQSDTHGETDFVNFPGLGLGGFDFVLANDGGAATSIPMTILGSGYVGIGTTAPQAPLDVGGGIRGSGNGVTVNRACAPEGMFGYDLASHQPVYCNSSQQWALLSLSGRQWHNVSGSRSMNTLYQNTNGYPIEVSIINVCSCAAAEATLFTGGTPSVGELSFNGINAAGDMAVYGTIPPGWYYKVTTWANQGTLTWNELY